MILHSVHIEHWRCIARLDLEELPAGVIVLHGPNRTGKSSVLRALRACLFDFDHDTTRAELKNSLPYNGSGPPRVTVVFETGGIRYRIAKVFSRKADGLARLEKEEAGRWRVLEDAPKEASRRTRELLGTEKSQAGLNQLLWLDQGVISLPEAGQLDGSLEKRLVGVLGLMVTGHDLGFKKALDKRCEHWFGVRGEHRPTSPVNVWKREREERQVILDEQLARLREVENAINALAACEGQLPSLRQAVGRAREELSTLQSEREQSRQRRVQHQQAARDCQLVEQQAATARKRLKEYEEAVSRWEKAEEQASLAQTRLQQAKDERERIASEHARIAAELKAGREAEELHQNERLEIEDCRTLLTLTQGQTRLAQAQERARQLQETIATLELEAGAAPPEEALLTSLQNMQRRIVELRAQLRAEALSLSLTAITPLTVRLSPDGRPADEHTLAPGESSTWPVREHAILELPGVGRVEIARSQKNSGLDRIAHELDRLEREYREAVLAHGEQPDLEGCLDRLQERRFSHQIIVDKLATARQDLQRAAPSGMRALKAEWVRLHKQSHLVLENRPHLASWQPDEDDVRARLSHFEQRQAVFQKVRKDRERAERQAAEGLQTAQAYYQQQHGQYIAVRTTAQNARAECERIGDRSSFLAASEEAEAALAAAQARLAAALLTEAEQSVEQRCRDAEEAVRLREERLEQVTNEMSRQRGRLEGSEGLHTRLMEAETAVCEAEDAIARESLEAAAHLRLRALFEECRDDQVQAVMGPIANRVLHWAKALGLSDYQEVRFGERFLPEGILLGETAPEAVRSLAEESYGTGEQLGLLVRLALGGLLARDEPALAILDDPLAHADTVKHRRILDILRLAAEGSPGSTPPAGPLQVLIFTCHPDRFDYLAGARQIDLARMIVREPC
jgi:hypothetical protein